MSSTTIDVGSIADKAKFIVLDNLSVLIYHSIIGQVGMLSVEGHFTKSKIYQKFETWLIRGSRFVQKKHH